MKNIFIVFVFLFFPIYSIAQLSKFTSPDSGNNREFGYSITSNCNRMVIAQESPGVFNPLEERLYIYEQELGTWNLKQTILSGSNLSIQNTFGARLAMTDEWLVANRNGNVQVYRWVDGAYEFAQTIQVELTITINHTISMNNEWMFLGGPIEGFNTARMEIYRFNGEEWELFQEIAGAHSFGSYTAFNGEWLAASTDLSQQFGFYGKIDFFKLDSIGNTVSWELQQSLFVEDDENDHRLGQELVMHKNILLASDNGWDNLGQSDRPNAVYMYALENGVWTQKQKLLSPSGVPGPGTDGNFGNSMQLDNDFLYIGERTLNKVHIYQYDLESATLIETLEGPSSSRFGDALHLRNDELMIGARGEDIFKGAVYRYQTPVDSIVLFAPCQSLPDSLFSVQIDSCSTKYMVVDGEEEWTFHFATLGQEVIDALDLDTFYCSITEVPSLGYEVNLTDSIIPMFSVEWTAEVIEDGMVYNASQLLDDPFSLNPTYEADVTGEIDFEILLKDMDGNVCDTIFKNLFIDEIICGGEVNVTIEEGEAITLMHNCIIDTSRVNMVIWEDPELNEIEGFNPTIVPTVPGPYVFIFEYEGTFCAGESIVNISFSTTTSTEETLEDKIKLYPNPARDHIYIDMAEDRKVQLSVLNFNGELLKQKTINQDDYLSLADFPNGVYLLKIETEQGHSFNKKIVKIK